MFCATVRRLEKGTDVAFSVFIVVILAAALHAGWNAALKASRDKAVTTAAIVVGHSPFALIAAMLSPVPDGGSLPYLLGGAVLHLGYQLFLMWAYRHGELSQIYPVARGVAPVLIALLSCVFLGQDAGGGVLWVVGLIASGLMLMAVQSGVRLYGMGPALLCGVFIASYSLVDGMGAGVAGTALGFYAWLSLLNAALMVLVMGVARPQVLKSIVTTGRFAALVGGAGSFAAYALVIWAFTQAPIVLVSALRETSILFALALARFTLGERVGRLRLLSVLFIVMGAALSRLI